VFLLDDHGIYIRGYQVNAMMKDAGQRTKATMKIKGLGLTIRDGGLLFPDRIYLDAEPHVMEKPVKPDMGSATIKIFQTAIPASGGEAGILKFGCALLDNGDLSEDLFEQLWIVSQGLALGANRHLGHGRFEIVSIEPAEDFPISNLFRPNAENGVVADAPVSYSPIAATNNGVPTAPRPVVENPAESESESTETVETLA